MTGFSIKGKKVLLCDCEGTMDLDGKAIARTFEQDAPFVFTQLCRSQQPEFQKAMGEGDLIVACGREAPLFEELRAELGDSAPDVTYVDIREKAAWNGKSKDTAPKVAAMLAESALPAVMAETVPMSSQGTVLVYGAADTALEAAKLLQGRLSPVLVIHANDGAFVPQQSDLPIFQGLIKTAVGHLGRFEVTFDHFAPVLPSSRNGFQFAAAENSITEEFDLILDLSDGDSLFPSNRKNDGYVKVSSTDTAGIYKALFELSDMVGEFSKPRYALVDENKCAHSRSRISGCTRCLDACSVSAIQPAGNHVAIDPYICEGCGDCSAVCPTEAITYSLPDAGHIHRRMQVMISTYLKAGGKKPVLLVHNALECEESLNVMGQIGSGLAPNVLPFALNSVAVMDHSLMLAAIAYGVEGVVVWSPSKSGHDDGSLRNEVMLAAELLAKMQVEGNHFTLLDEIDPERVDEFLKSMQFASAVKPMEGLAAGSKRQRARKVFAHLNSGDEILPVPNGSPYGQVIVNQDTCSMCMSCVGACPTQALRANSEKPILSFLEQDCVQCGLCQRTCPEKAISLEARLNTAPQAAQLRVLNEDKPAVCPDCGKEFGTQRSVDTVVKKLLVLPQFANPEQLNNLLKCEDCRVRSLVQKDDPFNFGARPKPRTTDDYFN